MQLGDFQLEEQLGLGGMGEVWLARHVTLRLPVAIKLVLRSTSEPERLEQALATEIEAVAGLDHPHIVRVHDRGVVSGRTLFPQGTPWLAMELLEGGSLRSHARHLDWPSLREVLLGLLDALAHAHARGVIHRDLKPANVLFQRGGDRPGLRLTDFGMGALLEADGDEELITGGTPAYMAPEQISGGRLDLGPWTDLYALGCMTWRLACGRPPFRGSDLRSVIRAHAFQEPPPLEPRFAVPDGLMDWIRGLMHKDPKDRFQRAADAALALLALPAAGAAPRRAPAPPGDDLFAVTTVILPDLEMPPLPPSDVGQHPVPTVPRSWRGARAPDPLPSLGLGLWGLRRVPVVGRTRERDLLWHRLREVARGDGARTVVLSGPEGCGKSRLASWLSTRAHEVGAARTWRAVHHEDGGAAHGLGPMVRTALRLPDDPVAALARLASIAGLDVEADAVLALSHPAHAKVRLDTATERQVAAAHLVRTQAAARPVLLWLDDAHWDPDAVGLAARLMEANGPTLVVLTVQDAALAERLEGVAALDDLTQRRGVSALALGPLAATDQQDLVQAMLGVDRALAGRIADRTGGNPLFAVQLVSESVASGALVPTDSGYRLRPGAELALPGTLREVWRQRVERWLADRPEWRVPLEIAAVLGRQVADAAWHAACRQRGIEGPPGLPGALVEARLAESDGHGAWRFVHGMLREAVLRMASDHGRLPAHHAACAAVFASDAAHVPRLGAHLAAAGRHAEALAPLLEGALGALRRSDFHMSHRLIDAWAVAIHAAGVPDSSLQWGDGWLIQLQIARSLGQDDVASASLTRLLETAATHPSWGRIRVQALIQQAVTRGSEGDLVGSLEAIEAARDEAATVGDEGLVANTAYRLGVRLTSLGRLAEAEPLLQGAAERCTANDDDYGAAHAWYALARVRYQAGDLDHVAAAVERSRTHAHTLGSRLLVAQGVNLLGDVAKLNGDPDVARLRYRNARRRYQALGHFNALIAQLNLLLLDALQGHALPATAAALRDLERRSSRAYMQTFISAGLLAADPAMDAGERAARVVAVSEWTAKGNVDREMVLLLDLAHQRHPDPLVAQLANSQRARLPTS